MAEATFLLEGEVVWLVCLTEAPENFKVGFCDWITVLGSGGGECNCGSHLLHLSMESLTV